MSKCRTLKLTGALTLIAVLFGAGREAHAANYQWTGQGNGDWFKAQNWSPNGVPGRADTVTIGRNFQIRGSKPVAIAGATVAAGSRVNFSTDCLVDGPLQLTGAEWSSSGALVVNGALNMDSATCDGSGSLTANGVANVSNSNIGGSKDFVVNNVFNAADSVFGGSGRQVINAKGVLNLTSSGGAGNIVDRTFSNKGLVVWVSGNLTVNKAFQNEVSAVVDVQSSGTLSGQATGSLFQNVGTVKRSRNGGKATVDIPYNNVGSMDLEAGTVEFTQELSQSSGDCSLNGGNIVARKGMKLHGGKLDGIGTIDGDVLNDGGVVGPGHSPGSITINGNYTQTANGTLNMEIGGTEPGVSFDKLIVNGLFQFNGALNISQYNGFLPVDGTNFKLFDFFTSAGSFAAVKSNFPPTVTFTSAVTPTYYLATAHLQRDGVTPTLVTKIPLANASYPKVGTASGTAADDKIVSSVTASLMRRATAANPAGYWAGGTSWTPSYTAAANEIPAVGTTSWSFKFPALSYGFYVFTPTAKDSGGNATLPAPVTFLISPGASTVAASTVTALAATHTVAIHFSGALDAVVAKDVARYSVALSSSNAPLTVQSVTYDGVSNTATLSVPAVAVGTSLTVRWTQLLDPTGRTVTGKQVVVGK